MRYEEVKVHRIYEKYAMVLILLTVLSAFLFVQSAYSRPRKVTWQDLEELKYSKWPENSTKDIDGGFFSKSKLGIKIRTPRARAASWVRAAQENYIELDSNTYYPDLFNEHVEVYAYNYAANSSEVFGGSSPKPEDLFQIKRAVLIIDKKVHESDSVVFHETSFQNAYGAAYKNIDATFFFPIELFTGEDDIKFVIFHSKRKVERKLKKKDINKLE